MQKTWISARTLQPSHDLGMCRVFKDPQGLTAAELIEQVGLRGQRIGSARIADASANFVQVESTTSSDDVEKLIDLMKRQVSSSLGVQLETEIEIW